MKRHFITLLLIGCTFMAMAQVKVESEISAVEMLVGQQVKLTVSVTAPADASVEFPQEALLPIGVEFMGKIDVPDVDVDNGATRHQRDYVLTSFDDTLYYLPPMTVKVNGQEYQTNQLALKVLTVEVDTTNYENYFGPKDVQANPFLWKEWITPLWLSVVMLLLLAIAYYLYLRLRDNKPVIARIRIVKRLLPHQVAMKAIEEIKADKIASVENPKEYYTRLTDTLRKYIEERYGFNAMEMTSREIIDELMKKGDAASMDELNQLFQTADLVKFAKYSTLINENDANLVSAIDFINKTKVEVPIAKQQVKQELTKEEKRSKASRRVLQTFITLFVIAAFLLMCYVVYSILELI